MSEQQYVPANVFLRCDKGVSPCQLKIVRPGPDLYNEKWAVEGDALPMVNVTSFGVCAITRAPCVPVTARWQNTLMGALQIDAGGLPQNPLLDNSFLPCAAGGKIDIFFTRAAVAQAAENAQQAAAAHEISHRAKLGAALLLGAAILVAGVAVVATGGAALGPILLVAGEAAATGAFVGATVGAVAGGIEGYGHGGAQGAAEGAAMGAMAGAIIGGLGAPAAAVGGTGAALFLGASGAAFGVATAADAFAFYKQPTLENGLVVLADVVALLGGRLVEGQLRGAKKLETTIGPEPQRCMAGKEPIDFASGAMFFTSVDFVLPGPVPLVWERTFYSTSERRGPLGYGWHHSYDQALWPDADTGTVALRLGDGRLAVFEAPGPDNGQYSYYRDRQLELRPAPDGADGYAVYHVRERRTYHFAPSARPAGQYQLTAIADGYGHALTLRYGAGGHLSGLTDSGGRAIGVRTTRPAVSWPWTCPTPTARPAPFPPCSTPTTRPAT
jgi:hypothetical protein